MSAMFNGAAFLGGCGPLGTTAPTVVDPDVVRGYRLASVSTNDDISYAMPADGTVRGTWHLTGAYEEGQMKRFFSSSQLALLCLVWQRSFFYWTMANLPVKRLWNSLTPEPSLAIQSITIMDFQWGR